MFLGTQFRSGFGSVRSMVGSIILKVFYKLSDSMMSLTAQP